MNTGARLTELEIKLSYQEDLVQSLNQIVAGQQQQIERLEAMIRLLLERMENLSEAPQGGRPSFEKPPHY